MELKITEKLATDLQDIIPELADPNNSISINLLQSKKNLVYDVVFASKPKNFPKELIIKTFLTRNAERERDVLLKLKPPFLPVPKILSYKKPYLLLEKVEGENLCDFINDNLMSKKKLTDLDKSVRDKIIFSVQKLAEWFANLHKQTIGSKQKFAENTALIKGEARLRDFVIDFSKATLYGVDFEDSYEGNHLDDISWICCSLLDTNPGIFEMTEPLHKIELINVFLKNYYEKNTIFKFNFTYFASKLIEDLNLVLERRNLNIGPVRKDIILSKISKLF